MARKKTQNQKQKQKQNQHHMNTVSAQDINLNEFQRRLEQEHRRDVKSLVAQIKQRMSISSQSSPLNDQQENPEQKDRSVPPKSDNQEPLTKPEQFRLFWESMNTDQKKEILVIDVQDLRHHLNISTASCQLSDSWRENFDEAIENGHKSQNPNCWEFWLCPHCDDTFTDVNIQEQHLREHGKEALLTRKDQLTAEWEDTILSGTWKPVDVPKALKLVDLGKIELPLCDVGDERSTLLVIIQNMLMHLQQRRHLDSTILAYLMHSIAKDLNRIIPLNQQEILLTKMAKPHLSICFLDKSQLMNILGSLQSLSFICDQIEDIPDKDGSSHNEITEVEESILLRFYKAVLILDIPETAGSCELIDWLFGGPSIEEAINFWISYKGDRKVRIAEYMQKSERLLQVLNSGSRTVEKIWNAEEAIRRLDKLCGLTNYAPKAYESLLKNRVDEIQDDSDKRLEFFELSSILEKAQNRVNQYKEQELALTSDDPARFQDGFIIVSLKENLKRVSLERQKADACTVKISLNMKKLAFTFKQISHLDYRLLLLPLLKSFLQTTIENRMMKDAELKKADDRTSGSNFNKQKGLE